MFSNIRKSFFTLASVSVAAMILSGCQTKPVTMTAVSDYKRGFNEFNADKLMGEIKPCLDDAKCYKSRSFKSSMKDVIHASFFRGEPEKLVSSGLINELSSKMDVYGLFVKNDLLSYRGYDLNIIGYKNQLLVNKRDYANLYSSILDEIDRNKDEKTVQRGSKIIRGMFHYLGCKSEFDIWGRVNSDFDPALFSSSRKIKTSMRESMTAEEFAKNASAIMYRDFKSLTISKACPVGKI